MVNMNRLKEKIAENSLSIGQLADAIEVDRSTFYRRIGKSGETFRIKEVDLLCKSLKLTPKEIMVIFFNQDIA